MKSVSISVLRENLPDYLARVARGERLRVTVRGRAVAEISPPAPEVDEAVAARARLKNSLVRFDRPLEPVTAAEEWDMNQ